MHRVHQRGFAVIPLVLILVAVLAVGTVAYVAFVQPKTNTNMATTVTANSYANTNSYTNTANANYTVNTNSAANVNGAVNANTNSAASTNATTNINSATAGWQTYTNRTLGFSLQYPADWEAIEADTGKDVFFALKDAGGVTDNIDVEVQDISLNAYLSELRSTESVTAVTVNNNGLLDGQSGSVVTYTSDPGGQHTVQFVRYKNQSYILNYIPGDEVDTDNTILSTFAFTN